VARPRRPLPGGTTGRADFNNDNFSDLAIGVPGEDVTTTDDGGVNVIYGSAIGLATNVLDQLWGPDTPSVKASPRSTTSSASPWRRSRPRQRPAATYAAGRRRSVYGVHLARWRPRVHRLLPWSRT
jgi:hypothetical protein